MRCFLLLFFLAPAALATDYFYYEMPKDVWVAAALRRLGVKDPWQRASWVERVQKYNGMQGDLVEAGQKIKIPLEIYPPGVWDEKGYVERVSDRDQSLADFLKSQGIRDPLRSFSYAIDVLVANDLKVVEAGVRPGLLLKIPYEITPDPPADGPLKADPKIVKIEPRVQVKIADKDYQLPIYEPSFELDYKDEESGAQYEFKKHHLSAALELADYQYSKTDVVDTRFTSALLRLAYRNLLAPPHWHFDVDAKLTMQSLQREQSNVDIQFYDFNLRAGYAFPWIPEPWRFTLMAGIYISSMSTNNPDFRYSAVGFAQIYPEFRRIFASGDSLAMYLRYSPTGSSPFSLGFDEYAGALGIKWTHPWRVPLIFGVEATTLKFQSRSSTRKIENSAVSVLFGLGL